MWDSSYLPRADHAVLNSQGAGPGVPSAGDTPATRGLVGGTLGQVHAARCWVQGLDGSDEDVGRGQVRDLLPRTEFCTELCCDALHRPSVASRAIVNSVYLVLVWLVAASLPG